MTKTMKNLRKKAGTNTSNIILTVKAFVSLDDHLFPFKLSIFHHCPEQTLISFIRIKSSKRFVNE